jgi:hypothetical protein
MTYELVNRRTANTLAVFDTKGAAVDCYEQYVAADPGFKFDLRLIGFDDNGFAVEVDAAPEEEPMRATPRVAG